MQQLKKNSRYILFLGICLLAAGLFAGKLTLAPVSSLAQSDQQPKLIWLEDQRKGPVIVTGHEALFQIRLYDELERIPNIVQVMIDANQNGSFDEGEMIALEEIEKDTGSITHEKTYAATVHFEGQEVVSGSVPGFSQVPRTFQTTFCFYVEIEGEQITGDPSDLDPADPNNQLVVLGSTDSDDDNLCDAEEGAEPLPRTYYQDPNHPMDAYLDSKISALETVGGKITMKIDDGDGDGHFQDVRTVREDDPNRPEEDISGFDFPYGFIYFRIEGLTKDKDEVELKVLFPNKITNYAEFCRYHANSWTTRIKYSPIDTWEEDAWRYEGKLPAEIERRSLILKLIDNNLMYDSDDTEGIIEDPWGLGIPKSSGEGRCFIHMTMPHPKRHW